MGRTLYLTETEKFKATVDGPSILIDWPNKAGQRIPLRLISRCVIVGNIKLESAVISTLTSHNIPVIFTDISGSELAIAIPYNHRLPNRWREQRIFLETTKNRERFINWARIKRMNLQLASLKRIFPQNRHKFDREIGEGDYQELLSFFLPKERAKWQVVKSFIESLFRSLIIEKLSHSGLNINLGIIHRHDNFGLMLDFAFILEPVIDEQTIQFFRIPKNNRHLEKKESTWALKKEGLGQVIHRFENKKGQAEEIIEEAIDEFFHLMRELRL